MIIEKDIYLKHLNNLNRIDRVAAGTAIRKKNMNNKVVKISKPNVFNITTEEVSKKATDGQKFIRTLFIGGAGYIPLKNIVPTLP